METISTRNKRTTKQVYINEETFIKVKVKAALESKKIQDIIDDAMKVYFGGQ